MRKDELLVRLVFRDCAPDFTAFLVELLRKGRLRTEGGPRAPDRRPVRLRVLDTLGCERVFDADVLALRIGAGSALALTRFLHVTGYFEAEARREELGP